MVGGGLQALAEFLGGGAIGFVAGDATGHDFGDIEAALGIVDDAVAGAVALGDGLPLALVVFEDVAGEELGDADTAVGHDVDAVRVEHLGSRSDDFGDLAFERDLEDAGDDRDGLVLGAVDFEELAVGAAHLGDRTHVGDQHALLVRRDHDVVQEGGRGGEGGGSGEEGLLALGVDGPDLIEIGGDELFADVDDALRVIESFGQHRHLVAVDLDDLAVTVALLAGGAHEGHEIVSTETLGHALGRSAHGEVALDGDGLGRSGHGCSGFGRCGGFLGLAANEGEASEKGEDGGLHETHISKLTPSGVKRSADDQPDRREAGQPGQDGLEGVLRHALQEHPAEHDARDDPGEQDNIGHQ